MSVHHLGTVFAHSLQVIDLALQEGDLGLQILLLRVNTHTQDEPGVKMDRWEPEGV